MTVEELEVLITANTTELRKEIEKTNSTISGLKSTAEKTQSGVTKAFKTLKTTIVALGIGKLIQTIFSNMDSAISRVDTLNNYSKVMSNLGVSTEDADASLSRLNDKLQGLPTTLDDAVSSVQRLTSANNNVKASTEMFLALNNALLAGGASTETQATALEQVSQAYSKGKPDMQEWRAMLTAMPAQLKQVATTMGYASTEALGEDLRSGAVSMNDFMKTIVQLNNEGIDGFESFEEQAKNSTGGISTSITNMKTAITRGLADIMNAIGQSNIAGFFQNIAKAINNVVPYITAFVKVCATAVIYISALFGKKTSSSVETTSSSISDLGSSASSTASDIDDTTDSVNSLSKSLNGLAGFDEMNVLNDNSSSSGSDSGSSSASSDLGDLDLSGWDTELDNATSKADEIAEKMIASIKSFADYVNGLDFSGIIGHLSSIKDTIVGIFTDSNVVNAGQNWINTLITTLSNVIPNIATIGINIATGLVGSIDLYLQQNSGRITDYIVSMFDISSRHLGITDKLVEAMAELSTVFSGETATQIGADIIAMFTNPFMSLTETFSQFCTDMYDLLVTPICDNIGLIKESFENTLEPISTVFSTLSDITTSFGDGIATLYDEHISPLLTSIKDGISDTLSKLLEGYNEYIVPFLDNVATGFEKIWNNTLKPLWNNLIEFIGNVFDLISWLWEQIIKPLIDWIIENVLPVLTPILNTLWSVFSFVFEEIGIVINTFLGIINGMITILKGVLSGDWTTIWNGIKKVISTIWSSISSTISNVISTIKSIISNGFNTVKSTISAVLNAVKSTVTTIWNGIWSTIKGVINSILGGIESMVNGVIKGLNTMIKAMNKLSFDIPDWVPELGGKKFGFDIKTISEVSLPRLAQGGIVDKPTYAMIGEDGAEAVMPLERNTGWIETLADKLASKMGSGDTPIYLTVKLGEETIFDKFIQYTQDKSFETNGEVFSI